MKVTLILLGSDVRAEWRDAMMRSYLTRLVNSVTRVALVTPCLLMCLACATPFPIENLEKGMTAENVRENFGEPRSVGMWPVEAEPEDLLLSFDTTTTSWTYVHEMQDWFHTFWASTVFLPHCALITAVFKPLSHRPVIPPELDWDHWCSFVIPTVADGTVVLHFEEEKLVRWTVIEPDWLPVFEPVSPEQMWERDRQMRQMMRCIGPSPPPIGCLSGAGGGC